MRKPFILLAILFAQSAAADALSDLRAVLARFPAASPFTVTATVGVSGDSQGVAGSRDGSPKFEVTTSAEGLAIRVPDSEIRAAAKEAKAKKDDPNTKTPTRRERHADRGRTRLERLGHVRRRERIEQRAPRKSIAPRPWDGT